RAHQAASSASSAREKWMRPLVVGPSPVLTPSRTMVRAWAAVLRQDGWRTPASAALVLRADIGVHFSISLLIQHFHAGLNEWLMIRNSQSLIFRWLPIGRRDVSHGSSQSRSMTSPSGRAVMRCIKGNIGALGPIIPAVDFSPQGRWRQEDARSSTPAEKDFSFCRRLFT